MLFSTPLDSRRRVTAKHLLCQKKYVLYWLLLSLNFAVFVLKFDAAVSHFTFVAYLFAVFYFESSQSSWWWCSLTDWLREETVKQIATCTHSKCEALTNDVWERTWPLSRVAKNRNHRKCSIPHFVEENFRNSTPKSMQ